MLKTQRQNDILKLLEEADILSVSDLSEKLNSSMMTIRRDLEDLESKGIIKKVHGGALLLKKNNLQPSFYERITEYSEEKERIGKAAAGMIKEGDIVFFDGGTTSLAVADNVSSELKFTAITNNAMTVSKLCSKSHVNVIAIGGEVHHSSFSAVNNIAIELINRFNADIAFISTKAFSYPEGLFEAELPLIEVKKAMVNKAKQVILLVDHSKFETKSLCKSVPLNCIDTIVTDKKSPADILENLKKDGKNIVLV